MAVPCSRTFSRTTRQVRQISLGFSPAAGSSSKEQPWRGTQRNRQFHEALLSVGSDHPHRSCAWSCKPNRFAECRLHARRVSRSSRRYRPVPRSASTIPELLFAVLAHSNGSQVQLTPPKIAVRWNVHTTPSCARRWGGSRLSYHPPSSSTRPEVGFRNPVIILNRVVLPAPLGPISATISPRCDLKIYVLDGHDRRRTPVEVSRLRSNGAALRSFISAPALRVNIARTKTQSRPARRARKP